MDRQGYENSGVTAGLPTGQRTTGISGTDPTLGGTGGNIGMTNTDTGYGTTGISPTGNTGGTVTDRGHNTTETRETEVTGVYVPVVPVEGVADRDDHVGTRHSDTHHDHHAHEKKPMGEKVKEKIPGTQAHKEHKAEKQMAEGRI